jgi:hypothetical protein
MHFRMIGRLLATLLSFHSSVKASKHPNTILPRHSHPRVEYYNGVPKIKHSARRRDLTKSGYRPISLSSHGSPHDARYSAIWVFEPIGPDFQVIHDVPKEVFDSWVERLRNRSYVLTHVTATGPEKEAIFAGVMEYDRNNTVWTLDCGIKDWVPFL